MNIPKAVESDNVNDTDKPEKENTRCLEPYLPPWEDAIFLSYDSTRLFYVRKDIKRSVNEQKGTNILDEDATTEDIISRINQNSIFINKKVPNKQFPQAKNAYTCE